MSADALARAIAAALVARTGKPEAMLARLRSIFGGERPWMAKLVEAARDVDLAFGDFVDWLRGLEAFADAVADQPRVASFPVSASEVVESALPVPADGPSIARSAPEVAESALPVPADRPSIASYTASAPEMTESPWRVPALATPRELAMWLGVDLGALTVLADRRGISRAARDPRARHYRYAWIPKPSGGHRLVEAPKARLRIVQRRILDGILDAIPPHDAAHGFRRGRSVVTFARLHVGRPVALRVDLEAFFTSVTAARVVGILRTAGYPEEVARMLAALCTHRTPVDVLARAPTREPRLRAAHLPQGAPTSGALANLAAYRLDVRVAALAARIGATYARYADDLVLSGDRDLARAAPSVVARLGAIAIEEGFALNFHKTRVMTAGERQRVTGIVVNDKLSAPRADVDRLRAILRDCVRHGPASQNRDGHPDFRAHLRGRVAWIASLDAAKGARLQAMFDQIRWD